MATAVRSTIYKSPHAGLYVKVRSALQKRHPVTGDVIETIPQIAADFGRPTGEARFTNPLTNESDILETYQGGTFCLEVAAEENGWSDDEMEMVRRRLDTLCEQRPAMCQRVDYVVAPAEKPWPLYDTETEPEKIAAMAVTLGFVGKALAYERENLQRQTLIDLLEAKRAETPDPEPEPEPVLAVSPKRVEPELNRVILA